MLDAVPPAPPAIMVEAASDRTPYLLLGFVATGTPESLKCIEKIADGPELQHGRTEGPNGVPEVMVSFLPGSFHAHQLETYQAARSGVCPGAKLEITLLPLSAFQSGKGVDEVTIEDPSFIVEPKP